MESISTHLQDADSILDPWNGSGTTTGAAAALGLSAYGLDVNPAVTVIAKARLTPRSIASSLGPLCEEIIGAAGRLEVSPGEGGELLGRWIKRPASEYIRALFAAISQALTERSDGSAPPTFSEVASNDLPILACFYTTALFAATRDILAPYRGSNPTWIRFPPSYRHRITPSVTTINQAFVRRVHDLAGRLKIDGQAHTSVHIETGSVHDMGKDTIHAGCLTSPPYATRIDYIRNSLPELAVLGVTEAEVARLRERATGTPVVYGASDLSDIEMGDLATRTVSKIGSHSSYASAGYYGKWIQKYLRDLTISFRTIHEVVAPGGGIAIVLQDSYYKDVRIDLQGIAEELFADLGRTLAVREDYPVRRLMARMNPSAREKLPERSNFESVLVFR